MLLRLCNAGLPNETKSCGRYCSGGLSIRSLLSTGSNVVDMFSLSSDGCDVKGSLLCIGVFGVMGMSSDMSEAVVVVLAGVLIADKDVRLGVTGKKRKCTKGESTTLKIVLHHKSSGLGVKCVRVLFH